MKIMDNDKQRIAIAEACPAAFYIARTGGIFWRNAFLGGTAAAGSMGGACDPLTDLNAMHEAEKVLTPRQFTQYTKKLLPMVDGFFPGEWPVQGLYANEAFRLVHSTAAQRAEAFLRTIGKWETSVPLPDVSHYSTHQHLGGKNDEA